MADRADELPECIEPIPGFVANARQTVARPKCGNSLMPQVAREVTMWAEMTPDVYGGPNFDEVTPRWKCWSAGDKGDAAQHATLELAARTFPPGTKITISEPLCPKCDEQREPIHPPPAEGPIFKGRCRCGFDWDAWVLDQFS